MCWRRRVWTITFVVMLLGGVCERGWTLTDAMRKPCASCHTIHNSQGGIPVFAGGTQEGLMNNTCVGCHTGTNDGSEPLVLTSADPSPLYDPKAGTDHSTLAAGNFWWVSSAGGNQDLMGHNVDGIGASQAFRTAPGDSEDVEYDATTPLTCAGERGCHGDTTDGTSPVQAIWGGHHAQDDVTPYRDGLSFKQSYRMLEGIAGKEDADWEYSLGAADHNQYKGFDRNSDTDFNFETSISSLCVKCHSDFHNDDVIGDTGTAASWGSPWIRHPVDVDMGGPGRGTGTPYDYGSGGAYQVATPLASENIGTILASVDLTGGANNAIITCISCHRAHGSPNDYSLRWDYRRWPAAGYNGCGDCHTTKKD